MIAHSLNMCAPYILCTFDNNFGIVELRHFYVYTTFGVLTLFIYSNQFHFFIFKLCIMIVHPLKMCTDDAGPEQSLVLFSLKVVKLHTKSKGNMQAKNQPYTHLLPLDVVKGHICPV